MTQPDDAFKIWVQQQPGGPGQLGFRGAVVKPGPQVAKTVTIAEFGDKATGEVKKRELRVRSYARRSDVGFEFDQPKENWFCENEEIDRLLAFLHTDVAETGRFRLVDTRSPQAALLEMVHDGAVDVSALVEVLSAQDGVAELVQALRGSEAGLAAAETAVVAQRRALVARLQEMSTEPDTTETDMQREMGDAYWLFGGRYVGVADRRNLVPLDQHDIPLVGADGALHIVELKGPVIPKLVRRHRNHLIVGNDVHEAVSQAMNYLRALDEMGTNLTTVYRDEFGLEFDMRRVFATVVIGHPRHVPDADAHQVEQTLRTYNAHLSRVEVITYSTLLGAAERALAFEQAQVSDDKAESQSGTTSPFTSVPDDRFAAGPGAWGDEPPF